MLLQENEQCECNSIISVFHDTNQKLHKMDLLERLTSNVVTQIVHNHIKKHVQVMGHSFDDVTQILHNHNKNHIQV